MFSLEQLATNCAGITISAERISKIYRPNENTLFRRNGLQHLDTKLTSEMLKPTINL